MVTDTLSQYIRLQTLSLNMCYLLLFNCKFGCTNATQCYFMRTLPHLFQFIVLTVNNSKTVQNHPVDDM